MFKLFGFISAGLASVLTAVFVLVGLYAAIALFVLLAFRGGEPTLEYMFEEGDPSAVVAIGFAASELALRLDASGHRHGGGGWLNGAPADVYTVMLDNDCEEAWFGLDAGASDALRIVGLESSGRCNETGSREELGRVFRDEFVARLEGRLPPLAYAGDESDAFYLWPEGEEPRLMLPGSLAEAATRFDNGVAFEHEYHDGIYYLARSACHGQFRAFEDGASNAVQVEGVGYVKPCSWSDDEVCLRNFFTFAILGPTSEADISCWRSEE